MCGNMVDIESATAENRRRKKNKKERRNHRGKIECPHLLHTAAIIINLKKNSRVLTSVLVGKCKTNWWRSFERNNCQQWPEAILWNKADSSFDADNV